MRVYVSDLRVRMRLYCWEKEVEVVEIEPYNLTGYPVTITFEEVESECRYSYAYPNNIRFDISVKILKYPSKAIRSLQ